MSEITPEVRAILERKLREAGAIGLNVAADMVDDYATQEDDPPRRLRLRVLARQIRETGEFKPCPPKTSA